MACSRPYVQSSTSRSCERVGDRSLLAADPSRGRLLRRLVGRGGVRGACLYEALMARAGERVGLTQDAPQSASVSGQAVVDELAATGAAKQRRLPRQRALAPLPASAPCPGGRLQRGLRGSVTHHIRGPRRGSRPRSPPGITPEIPARDPRPRSAPAAHACGHRASVAQRICGAQRVSGGSAPRWCSARQWLSTSQGLPVREPCLPRDRRPGPELAQLLRTVPGLVDAEPRPQCRQPDHRVGRGGCPRRHAGQ